jgi:hypothetical protein
MCVTFPCLLCTVNIFILPFKTHLVSYLKEIYAAVCDFHITTEHVSFGYAQDEAKLKPVHLLPGMLITGKMKLFFLKHFM